MSSSLFRALVLTLRLSTAATAALIEADWQTPGDKLLTVDTGTGLEWLDVTASTSLSYNDVLAEFSPGGNFEGFRHATVAETTTLFENAGIPAVGRLESSNFGPVTDLIQTVGLTHTIGLFDLYSSGINQDSGPLNTAPSRQYSYLHISRNDGLRRGLAAPGAGDTYEGVAQTYVGHWLVRQVPEPGTLGLLALGMVAVLGRRRQ